LHRGRLPKPFPSLAEERPIFDRAEFGRILYPTAGSILALDPDIPPGREIVEMEVTGKGSLLLDGAPLGGNRWAPTKGKHLLSLKGPGDSLIDEVKFEVR
jgi:penicillin-binding protein 1C